MLVKHMIRELMKCGPNEEVLIKLDGGHGRTCNTFQFVTKQKVYLLEQKIYLPWEEDSKENKDIDYDNTHDTPFPLPEKE